MDLSVGEWIVIGICAILILGYIRGYYYNRQRAEQILAWLQPGLEKLGKVSPGAGLGGLATGGRLNVFQPMLPFKQVEVVYLLEPRENLLFWLFHRLQGRRDELILKISLPKPPKVEMEIKRRGRGELIRQGEGASEQIEAFMEQYRRAIFLLALRHEHPQLFVRANLPELMTKPAETFFTALQGII
jgi:hypothetical protein